MTKLFVEHYFYLAILVIKVKQDFKIKKILWICLKHSLVTEKYFLMNEFLLHPVEQFRRECKILNLTKKYKKRKRKNKRKTVKNTKILDGRRTLCLSCQGVMLGMLVVLCPYFVHLSIWQMVCHNPCATSMRMFN